MECLLKFSALSVVYLQVQGDISWKAQIKYTCEGDSHDEQHCR